MKDWYFRRQLKSSNVCVDFVFHRRRCQFPNSPIGRGGGGGGLFPQNMILTENLMHLVSKFTNHHKYAESQMVACALYTVFP